MPYVPAKYGYGDTVAEPERTVDLTLCIHQDTPRAWLVSLDGDSERACWLPKSEVEVGEKDATGFAPVVLPEWLALNRKLINV